MLKNGHGGKRLGAGKPKGTKNRGTLEKEAARELVRQLITDRLGPLIEAQLAHAEGLKYLVTRDKRTGKFIRVTEAMARAKGQADPLADHEETIEVWEKDPSVQAFTDLLNRALDKPAEQLKVTGDDGGPVRHVFSWQK
jgi:hypothetical protein